MHWGTRNFFPWAYIVKVVAVKQRVQFFESHDACEITHLTITIWAIRSNTILNV